MKVDLLFDPFRARWTDVRAGAIAAEQAGFDGVWLYDHLAGSVHGVGRGPARMWERPMEIVMRQWATRQMRHLLALASARSPSSSRQRAS